VHHRQNLLEANLLQQFRLLLQQESPMQLWRLQQQALPQLNRKITAMYLV
jgi:hypothetical protein